MGRAIDVLPVTRRKEESVESDRARSIGQHGDKYR